MRTPLSSANYCSVPVELADTLAREWLSDRERRMSAEVSRTRIIRGGIVFLVFVTYRLCVFFCYFSCPNKKKVSRG